MITAYTVSAFTANGRGGNKAGVVLETDGISSSQMLAIAKELNYSETAFVSKSTNATYAVRFFTPIKEVDLCGHATIAAWSLLFQKALIKEGTHSQETLVGILEITISNDGTVFMQQTEPQFFSQISYEEIMPVLNASQTDFKDDLQPQIVSTGLTDLLVPIRSRQTLMSLQPDFDKMINLSEKYNVTGLHVFTYSKDCTAIARNFAPLVGIDEESATGTSNGALLCYLKENDRLKEQDVYYIEQGESLGQLSNIVGKFTDNRVWIGGQASVLNARTIEV